MHQPLMPLQLLPPAAPNPGAPYWNPSPLVPPPLPPPLPPQHLGQHLHLQQQHQQQHLGQLGSQGLLCPQSLLLSNPLLRNPPSQFLNAPNPLNLGPGAPGLNQMLFERSLLNELGNQPKQSHFHIFQGQ